MKTSPEQFVPFGGNLVICVHTGRNADFSCLISDCIPDANLVHSNQCFPLYLYEEVDDVEIATQASLF